MAVHRADILEAHLLEHRGVVDAPAHQLFAALQRLDHDIARHRDTLQRGFHLGLNVEVFGVGAQFGQIIGHLADVFRDRHLVVVQDADQVVQLADVVHALVDHAARKGAVAHDDDHFARLAFEFFGTGNADGGGQRRAAVTCNEGITGAFLRVGEAGQAVFLAQLGKASHAAGEQFMSIALVANVKQNFILRQVQGAVQSHRKLYHTQVGGQVPPCCGNTLDQKLTNFLAQGRQFTLLQPLHIAGRLDAP